MNFMLHGISCQLILRLEICGGFGPVGFMFWLSLTQLGVAPAPVFREIGDGHVLREEPQEAEDCDELAELLLVPGELLSEVEQHCGALA